MLSRVILSLDKTRGGGGGGTLEVTCFRSKRRVYLCAAKSFASPSRFNSLFGGSAMFSHIHWRALSPNVRDALLFGLVAALVLCSLSARQAIAAPQAATRDPQSLQFLAGALAAMGGNSISQLQLGVLALGTLRAAPGGNSGSVRWETQGGEFRYQTRAPTGQSSM